MQKNRQYQVLNELRTHNLISRSLMLEISDSVEIICANEAKTKRSGYAELIDFVPSDLQIEVDCGGDRQIFGKWYGNNFMRNAFFRPMDKLCIIEFLQHAKKVTLSPGEHIYAADQAADSSSECVMQSTSSSAAE